MKTVYCIWIEKNGIELWSCFRRPRFW